MTTSLQTKQDRLLLPSVMTSLLGLALMVVSAAPNLALAEDGEISYSRLSIEQVNEENHPLFDTVVVGTPMGTSIALLTQEASHCSLEIHDATDGGLKVKFDDHRFCNDVEYEDGYSLYNMPEYKSFLKSHQLMLTSLLASFDIKANEQPGLPDYDNPAQKCAYFTKIKVCGAGKLSLI